MLRMTFESGEDVLVYRRKTKLSIEEEFTVDALSQLYLAETKRRRLEGASAQEEVLAKEEEEK